MIWAHNVLGSVRDALFIFTTLYYETIGFSEIWVNTPGDKGGPTMWGIASRYAPPGIAAKIVSRRLRMTDAILHIQSRYIGELTAMVGPRWRVLDHRVAFVLFDSHFHGSLSQTTRWMQEWLVARHRELKIDGALGPVTAGALLTLSPAEISALLSDLRAAAEQLGSALAKATMQHTEGGIQSADFTKEFIHRAQWRADEAREMPVPS